mgnify:CR=1 FL=1
MYQRVAVFHLGNHGLGSIEDGTVGAADHIGRYDLVLIVGDFNVPLKGGEITDETRIVAALPTIQKLISDGGKVILCSHLGKVKEGPNEKESLAPVAKRLSEKLGKEVVFVADYNVTGEAATAAVAAMKESGRTI